MALWFAALLGLVQGLTEFIPVSSTAHLRIFPALLSQPDPGVAFSAVIQLGTLLAVIVYFAKDLFVTMPRAMFEQPRSPQGRLPWYLIAGTVPTVVAGLTLEDFVSGDARSLWVVSCALIGLAVLMVVADRVGKLSREIESVALIDAMVIGAAQALALIPGTSRSGATIVCALLLGFRRSDAARFSFLLGIPAIAGAGLFELRDAVDALGDSALAPILVGTGVAFVSGYASIAWLLRFLGKHSLASFALYRIALGALILALLWGAAVAPQ